MFKGAAKPKADPGKGKTAQRKAGARPARASAGSLSCQVIGTHASTLPSSTVALPPAPSPAKEMVNALDAMTMAFSNSAKDESSGAVLSAMAR